MAALKYSRQRQEIKDHLIGRFDHPTAEMIYTSLKESDPRLSLATVYRNLALLIRTGEVRRVQAGEGPDHFDAKTTPHQHLICKECGCITDVYPEGLEEAFDAEAQREDFVVEQILVAALGRCSRCSKKEKL